MKEEEKEVEELKGIGSWNGRKKEKLEEGGGNKRVRVAATVDS